MWVSQVMLVVRDILYNTDTHIYNVYIYTYHIYIMHTYTQTLSIYIYIYICVCMYKSSVLAEALQGRKKAVKKPGSLSRLGGLTLGRSFR